jgi:hypothetical protein
MAPDRVPIPSVEAIEYGRRVILAMVEKYERFAAIETKDADRSKRHLMRAAVMRCELLGGVGCVVAPFDERWLDPKFRAVYEKAVGDGT